MSSTYPFPSFSPKYDLPILADSGLTISDQEYLVKRASLVDLGKAISIQHGDPINSSDTIYLVTADKDGNSCSLIASNYAGAWLDLLDENAAQPASSGFGTGAIPKGCGFTLQNRGTGFTLQEGHPNNVKGGKRPYHTIIPGMVTQGEELLMSYGVMGGFMQPQGTGSSCHPASQR